MKNLAIIPARGGSKRIPRKNIKPFLGKPIMAYSIEAAIKSELFDEVMVSTDDEEIAQIARQYGAAVPFLRSEATANDYATTADVLIEVLECYKHIGKEFNNICCIYSTAPFITSEHLQECYELLKNGINAAATVVEYSYPIQRSLVIRDDKLTMAWPKYKQSRSQDLEPHYHDAGQFYFLKVMNFMSTKAIWTENMSGLVLSELEVQDLDTMTDWKLAEMKYKLLHE
jgi:N-acylneuraminate cytidylyltransferase